MRQQPVLILHHLQPPVGMHHRVVPGRHDLAVLRLGGIPAGPDVGFGTLKNHQRIGAPCRTSSTAGWVAPGGIRSCPARRPRPRLHLQHRRQMRGEKSLAALRDENRKRLRTHQRVRLGDVVDLEQCGHIHGVSLAVCAAPSLITNGTGCASLRCNPVLAHALRQIATKRLHYAVGRIILIGNQEVAHERSHREDHRA